jgi:phenylpropionate dioxygenase-like ring-hydroxylating dioxygenase large terminal subunit
MLSREENELMCRVGPGTAMGTAARRFWIPAIESSELPGPDCDPKHVELFGEHFVAFRDTNGNVGILDELCPHRNASLLLGRVEECGIRCIYHGWKFGLDGTLQDTPNVDDPEFKKGIKAQAYPVREAGGLVWTYIGPAETEPPFPKWPFLELPDEHRINAFHMSNCNFVQVLEGLLDSSHLSILHIEGLRSTQDSDLSFARKTGHMQFVSSPRLEAEQTDFGYHYAALRDMSDANGEYTEARIAAFTAPCFVSNPNGDIWHACVPMNDTQTKFYFVWWNPEEKIGAVEMRDKQLEFVGLDPKTLDECGLGPESWKGPNAVARENNYGQDRELLRQGHFSGLRGFMAEDAAVSISPGPIRDRTKEYLSPADIAVVHLYRTLLKCARQAAAGEDPVGLHADTSKIIGTNAKLAKGDNWRAIVPHNVVKEGRAMVAAAK